MWLVDNVVARIEGQRGRSQQGIRAMILLRKGVGMKRANKRTSSSRVGIPLSVQKGVHSDEVSGQHSVAGDAPVDAGGTTTAADCRDHRCRLDREQRSTVVALGEQGRIERGPAVVRNRGVIHGVEELVLVLWQYLNVVRYETLRSDGLIETNLRCLGKNRQG